ncbi:MAG TPA: YtxH domain-containing protein [Nitrospirales bacterium]|nr:YtxH domain-containing protein [Nitrospirales bacterium]
MADYESGGSEQGGSGSFFLAFLAGAAIGAVAALLLAPQSGRESRDQLRRAAKRTQENLKDAAGKAGESWEAALQRGREVIREQKSVLSEALEAGREALRRDREGKPGEPRT